MGLLLWGCCYGVVSMVLYVVVAIVFYVVAIELCILVFIVVNTHPQQHKYTKNNISIQKTT